MKKIITITLSALLSTCLAVIMCYIGLSLLFPTTFFPNTHIAGINMTGKTLDESIAILNAKYQETDDTMSFSIEDKTESATIKQLGFNIELEKTAINTYKKGRSGDILKDIPELFSAMTNNTNLQYTFNKELLEDFLENKLALYEIQYKRNLLISEGGELSFSRGKPGKKINQIQLFSNITKKIFALESTPIQIQLEKTHPKATQAETALAKNQIKKINKPLELSVDNKQFTITKEKLESAVKFTEKTGSKRLSRSNYLNEDNFNLDAFINESLGISNNQNEIIFGAYLDRGVLTSFINEEIAPEINKEPENARFNVNPDNTIELVKESIPGQKVLIDTNIKYIEHAVLYTKNQPRNVALHIEPRGANVDNSNINNLGITELLATGSSNFAGSPSARRHNIAVGVEKIDGILVAPGEEYSFTTHLGEVSAAAGYLPELVIKPGKLIKEYGGGICQVSTTVFRGAINAGLKITERQAHGFPVSYYSPLGTDATIYIPSPDLKFINDTKNYILIQGELSGNTLDIKFYGTSDNRKVALDGPHQFNHGWAGPGSVKTKWTQTVNFSDGTSRSKTFWSNYKSPESYDR